MLIIPGGPSTQPKSTLKLSMKIALSTPQFGIGQSSAWRGMYGFCIALYYTGFLSLGARSLCAKID